MDDALAIIAMLEDFAWAPGSSRQPVGQRFSAARQPAGRWTIAYVGRRAALPQ